MKKIFVLVFLITNLFAIQRQVASNWCWAASIQDVLYQAGIYQTQAQIATILNGWPQNRPAYEYEVIRTLKAYGLQAWRVKFPATPKQLYSTFNAGYRIIAFVNIPNSSVGHFIVLQGVDNNSGGVYVSDPLTGTTYISSVEQLYYYWKWNTSIIVGDKDT